MGRGRGRTRRTALAAALAALASAGLARARPEPVALAVRRVALAGEPAEVVAADVSGDGLRDLVISHAAPGGRRISVVRQRPGGAFPEGPDQALVPPPEAYAFVVADLAAAPGEEVAVLCTDGIRIWRRAAGEGPGSAVLKAAPERLVGAAGFVELPPHGALVRWDGVEDLDGDGIPDLILPQRSGYLVLFQGRDRSFSLVQALPLEAEERVLTRSFPLVEVDLFGSIRTLPRLHAADFDGDGRRDLLALHRARLTGFLQEERGLYPAAPSFREDVAFLRPRLPLGTSDEFERKRAAFAQLDPDGLADLVVTATEGTVGLFSSIKTSVAVFLGRPGALFAARPDQAFLLPGAPVRVEVRDLTRDSVPDLIALTVRTDLIGAALAGGVSLTTRIYRGTGRGFDEEPILEDTAEVTSAALERGDPAPQGRHGADVSGDGLPDRISYDPAGRLLVTRSLAAEDGRLAMEAEPWGAGAVPGGAVRLELESVLVPGRTDVVVVYRDGIAVVTAGGAR
ncbi:MAG: VCBS repeat-containing protein [Planctomycetales bacterium]|nr:VCBS repeat-containing protein [Planctomycetales bacterium]